jgi:hypothetical protein
MMKPTLFLLSVLAGLVFSTGALTPSTGPAHAEEPEIIFQFPEDGDVIAEPPLVLQMCFQNPVDVRDEPPLDEGDFEFSLIRPDGISLGMRIVFQPDGYGVAIYPGVAEEEPPEGEWTWEYRVVDRESLDPLEGTVTFSTSAAEGEQILQPTPPACLGEGATQVPTGDAATEDETPDATPDEGEDDDDDDGGLGVLELALITIGIAAVAAVVGGIAYLIRRRVGYEPHAPSGDGGGDHGDDQH